MTPPTALPLAAVTLGALSATAAPALAGDDHGMSARYEHRYHVTRPGLDPDRDGLTNLQEYHLGTNPRRADSDRYGIRDGDEDFDRDGVDNANELREGTDPRRRDTDRDGISDGAEDADHDGLTNAAEDRLGADPVDRDTDDDGVPDGREHAGTVATFAAGVLTISLPDGSTITAQVTPATVVKCRTESEYQSAYVRHSSHPTAVAAGHAGPGPSGPGGHGGSGSSGGGYDDP